MNSKIENIKKLGLHFAKQPKGVDSKLEELPENPTKEEFFNFLNEETDWNICDCCGEIDTSTNLRWLENDENYFDEDYHIQRFISAFTSHQAVCDSCFDSFGDMTFLSLEQIRERLSDSESIFREGEKIFSKKEMKVFTVKSVSKDGYIVDGLSHTLSDDMLFDMVNFALCQEFATVVDRHTDRIEEYDELNTINYDGQLELDMAFKTFGLKKEFEEYLTKNDFIGFI